MAVLIQDVKNAVRYLLQYDAIRFLGVGFWNLLFSAACFAILLKVVFRGSHYMMVLVLSTILGVTNSFVCHRWFTFRSTAPILRAYFRFYVVYGFQIGLTFLLMPVCVELLKLDPVVAQISLAVLTTVLTYFAHQKFSFREKSSD